MKALSLWQPYASAIACGSKLIETRHWATTYRGPLAIHAAKRCIKDELIDVQRSGGWCGALYDLGVRIGQEQPLWEVLPFGAIVAVVQLVDCVPTEDFTVRTLDTNCAPEALMWKEGLCEAYSWTERMFGNFAPGRFGWVLEKIQRVDPPMPFRGAQQLFDVEI